MTKHYLIAANWKMNSPPEGFESQKSPYRSRENVVVAVFPSFMDIPRCLSEDLVTGGQCGRPQPVGAFTGDVSMMMLKDMGCTHVLCGHSERRKFHGETDADVAAQAKAAMDVGLIPIVCVGESEKERSEGKSKEIVRSQLTPTCSQLKAQSSLRLRSGQAPLIVIAYEPVWAIGTGNNATAEQAQDMHAFIRSLLPEKSIRILYGGSMNEKNARELLSQKDVDGGLVGGASLKPEAFRAIVETAGSL